MYKCLSLLCFVCVWLFSLSQVGLASSPYPVLSPVLSTRSLSLSKPVLSTKNHKPHKLFKPKSKFKRTGWFSPLYLVDWSIAIGLGVGGPLLLELIPVLLRDWAPGDRTLTLPYQKQPSLSLPVSVGLSVGVPLLGLGLAQLGIRSGHDLHHGMLGLVEAMALTAFSTQMLQVVTGRLRPDWFERCRPNIETLKCTGDADVVAAGRRSFPSLEASLAFAGGVYLSLYLAGHLQLSGGAGWFWKIPVLLTPLAGAVALSLLPVLDYRNHVGDVLVGGLLGTGFAILAYHLNFYPIWDNRLGHSRARHRVTWLPMLSPSSIGMAVAGKW